jgi:hypothetical protein
MVSLLDRYRAGEYEKVWDELVAYGAAVREEPLLSDALTVARETMRRVRANIEVLVQRLDAAGYVFDDAPVPRWENPRADATAQVRDLEALVGAVPLSIRACYEAVGTVNFMGHHPSLEHRAEDRWDALPDPLVIFPIDSVIDDCRERLEDPEWDRDLPLDLALAPDILHKADISGGGPYGVHVPDAAADAQLHEEWHETSFVNYLRLCFRWGGFPGLERYANPPRAFVEYLTNGLLPL